MLTLSELNLNPPNRLRPLFIVDTSIQNRCNRQRCNVSHIWPRLDMILVALGPQLTLGLTHGWITASPF